MSTRQKILDFMWVAAILTAGYFSGYNQHAGSLGFWTGVAGMIMGMAAIEFIFQLLSDIIEERFTDETTNEKE